MASLDRLEILPIRGIPEIAEGADLVGTILAAVRRTGVAVEEHDIFVVKQKIVSKAEGRLVRLAGIRAGSKARRLALAQNKGPRLVELILRESRRVVRAGHGVIITETRHGFVCANSGIDRSNIQKGYVALLPLDPDRSARRLRKGIESETGRKVAVVITDTFGRPWRKGQTDVAIGCSGIDPLLSYVGKKDRFGYHLRVTEPAVVDEIAGAAELVAGKLSGVPVTIVRGLAYRGSDAGARALVLEPRRDLFR
jgi:coenzyme F420-0:L-glutamate ligase/coenzyme F420-1:gamma-L-glutamate ligase